MNLQEAHAAFEAAELAALKAEAEFRENPGAKTLTAQLVTRQLAENAKRPVEEARAEEERARRSGLEAKLADARERARHSALLEKTAAARARLVAISAEAAALVSEIEAAVTAQHRATVDAEQLARELGTHSDAQLRFPLTRLRHGVGIEIALAHYSKGRRWTIGWSPDTWLAARSAPPSASPAIEEWRQAKALFAPQAFLPPAVSDFSNDAATVSPFDVLPNGVRPARHELDR